jgi:hypothetical protein
VGAGPRKSNKFVEKAAERRRKLTVVFRRRSGAIGMLANSSRGLAPTAKIRAPLRGDAPKWNTKKRKYGNSPKLPCWRFG